jgi:hypothetical protein
MRYWRYHSKHVLTNALELVGVVGCGRRIADRMKCRAGEMPADEMPADEMIVAG